MIAMRAGPNCYAVIRHFELCKLKAYPDPKTGGAPWTAMYGATGPDITKGFVFTQAQADARLMTDVALREADANNAVLVPVTQGMFDAFVSALFNIGRGSPAKDGLIRLRSGYPSTFLRLLNAADYLGARGALGMWVSPGTNVEHGLHRRRTAEQALWDGRDASAAIAAADAV